MQVLATSAIGASELLAEECRVHGFRLEKLRADGVELDLNAAETARALVHLRLADTLLLQVAEVPAPHANRLYHEVRDLRWERWFDAQSTLSVGCIGVLPDSPEGLEQSDRRRAPPRPGAELRSPGFAAQKIADAVIDRLHMQLGIRPSVEPKGADVQIVARFGGETCTLLLDLAGMPLFRRGVRLVGASLRSTWAAAMVAAAGWHGQRPLLTALDPGGVLAIEAVWRMLRIAPNSRREFAIERWPHDGERLRGLLGAERERALAHEAHALAEAGPLNVLISAPDRGELKKIAANLTAAGMAGTIRAERLNARRLPQPGPGTLLLASPPGQGRIDADVALKLVRDLGEQWRGFVDCEAWIVTDDPDFPASFGKRPYRIRPLSNGDREASLLHYRLSGATGAAPGERAS